MKIPAARLPTQKKTWPLLSENIIKSIVDEAHQEGRKVAAHLGETKGAQIAVNAGIDEWAHVPCDVILRCLAKKADGTKRKNSHDAGYLAEMCRCCSQCQHMSRTGRGIFIQC